MIKSKNAVVGIAAVVAASVLLVAGLGVTATTGAATDFTPPDYPLEAPAANPPASPVEPPATNPGGTPAGTTDPNAGAPGGIGANPAAGALPDAGFGVGTQDGGMDMLVLVLAAAGVALVGAGATVVGSRRS
ncbi:MAG: hypothetical protein WEB52_01055 [Dehalococcoidia bacterium]